MPFKFDSATAFLTYPHSELTHDQIHGHLGTVATIVWARIATERHADGSDHQHAVVKWDKRVQSKNERLFDIEGRHPNIQSIRSVKRAIDYVSKDGQFTDYGTIPSGKANSDTDWVAAATEMEEAEYLGAALQARVPFMYAKRFWELANKQTTEIPLDYEGCISRECFELIFQVPAPDKVTLVLGPTGCGKSSWAKRVSQKPALWVRHMDMLRTFRPGHHKSIIFDDMAFSHLHREAQIHITDWHDDAAIHCRYGIAIIPKETQKIFTANTNPFTDDPAIKRRIHLIQVTSEI